MLAWDQFVRMWQCHRLVWTFLALAPNISDRAPNVVLFTLEGITLLYLSHPLTLLLIKVLYLKKSSLLGPVFQLLLFYATLKMQPPALEPLQILIHLNSILLNYNKKIKLSASTLDTITIVFLRKYFQLSEPMYLKWLIPVLQKVRFQAYQSMP